jgi:hypothetical protein
MVKIFRGCSLAAPFLFLEPYELITIFPSHNNAEVPPTIGTRDFPFSAGLHAK